MFEEREVLVKYTFPELRRRCRERGIEFVDIDLRWGIPEEEKAEGKVLPICLAMIERCRPYFIGILGERYGWVPEEIDEELAEVQPWLKEHKEKSITELEIIHGVLGNPEMEKLAFFYFRDPKKSQEVEEELSKQPDYKPEPESSKEKLKKLKEEILKEEKNFPVPVRRNFPDAKTLGQWVLDDLWNVIDKRFPAEEVPTPLQRERMEHEAFAAARRRVYIGREEYFRKLDEHIESDGPPLVILGEPGSGKSALIANWAQRYREKYPNDFLLLHFIGSTPESTDYVHILRRIMQEIKERYGDVEEIPTEPKQVVEAFPFWLARASARGRFIIVLDALNQLEEKDNAPELGWLPSYFPPNIRLILSTLPGPSLEALKERNYPTLTVEPLTEEERERFIREYLARFGKSLSEKHIKQIVSHKQSANPLYLRTLLEELRVFGIHEELERRITYYLEAQTPDALFEKVLERLEEDYEREEETKGLVRNAMSFIWASRRGLSEVELLELLKKDDEPLPRAYWSPLYLAIEESLVNRGGLLNFFHSFLREAVERRYLPTPELKKKYHLLLADYFRGREISERKADELPWQFMMAGSWEELKDSITDLGIFTYLMLKDREYELTGYWLALGDRFDMVREYEKMVEFVERTSRSNDVLVFLFDTLGKFLRLSARFKEAERLYRRALDIREKTLGKEHPDTITTLDNLARVLDDKGDYEEAEKLYRRALEIFEKTLGKEHPNTATTLNSLAILLRHKGNYEEAEKLFRRALEISEKILGKEHPNTATTLNNLANLLYDKGDYEEAERLFRRALEIRGKTLGKEHPDTATVLNNLALLLHHKGDYEEAEKLYRRALEIREKTLGKEHPNTATTLNNLALLLDDIADYEGAEQLYRRALAIDEKVWGKDHPNTANILNNLGKLLFVKGDYEEAERLFRRALEIREKVLGKEHPHTATTLNNLASLLHYKGDYEEAEKLYRRALEICEKTLGRTHPWTITCRKNLEELRRRREEGSV
jgi:tetratricopeptide (TPR) repeat protein